MNQCFQLFVFLSVLYLVSDHSGWHTQILWLIFLKSVIPVIKKTVCISDEEAISVSQNIYLEE